MRRNAPAAPSVDDAGCRAATGRLPTALAAGSRSLFLAIVAILWGTATLSSQHPATPLPPALESYAAHLAAAEAALQRGAIGEVWRWLDAVPAAERGFEWRLLANAGERSEHAHLVHPAGLSSLAISPDGAHCAVGTYDGKVLLFATAALTHPTTGEPPTPRLTIPAHQHMVYCLCFDATGDRLASSSQDRGAKVWEVASGRQLAEFGNHTYPVGSIRFAPDGQRLCSSSYQRPNGGEIRIWEASSGRELAVLQSGYAPMTCSHWSPDGSRIVGASWDQQLHVFELAKPDSPIVQKLGAEGTYRAAQASALSPDGRLVAVACKDQQVHLFEAWTGQPVRDCVGHRKIVEGVAFSPDGVLLATVSADSSLRLWNVADGTAKAVLHGHRGLVRGVAFTGDGAQVLTASADGSVRAWRVATALAKAERIELATTAYHIAERPDGAVLALGDAEGRLQLCSPDDGRVREELSHDAGWIAGLRWHQEGERWQLLASGQPLLQLWEPGGEPRRTFVDPEAPSDAKAFGGGIDGVARSADGRRIAAVSRDGKARLWDAASGALRWRIDLPRQALRVAFAPAGDTLGICGLAGAALHDAATGAVRLPLVGHRGSVQALCFAPDGTEVMTLGDDGTLRFWQAAEGRLLATARAHDGRGQAAALSPDGRRLATCGDDQRLVLWDVAARAPVWARDLANGYCLHWSHDGQRLWVLTLDKELYRFEAAPAR